MRHYSLKVLNKEIESIRKIKQEVSPATCLLLLRSYPSLIYAYGSNYYINISNKRVVSIVNIPHRVQSTFEQFSRDISDEDLEELLSCGDIFKRG